MFRKLVALRDKILKLHEIKEGIFYRYIPYSVFVSMCEAKLKKIEEEKKIKHLSRPVKGYLDMYCFRANTYNDPREGKILIELSEREAKRSRQRGLLAELYQETEIERKSIDINSMVFVGSFIAEKPSDLSIWAKRSKNNFTNNHSPLSDSLPMWRDYADKGKGVCLEVYIKPTDMIPMYRISYNEKEQLMVLDSICSILADFSEVELRENATRLREIIDPIRFLFKSPEHDYENEARIIEICGFNKETGILTSMGSRKTEFEMNLLKNEKDPSLSRLFINFENFYFKNKGAITVGPAFDESDYLFSKRVIIEQIYYWLKKLNLLDDVKVKVSQYNIRF